MSGPDQHTVLAPDDGSLGPLLRVSDDRLAPGEGYGGHEHRAVDVLAVLLAGSLRHRWRDGAVLAAGDVAVLRAGSGLVHDESAGDDGARVLQCYLRPDDPEAPPSYEVHRTAAGPVDLRRADAGLWVGRGPAGELLSPPAGLLLVAGERTQVRAHAGGPLTLDEAATVLVWHLETGRPAWAED
ncbi:pirin family protein [Candidatus Blastococcus massiliensis]|uniref:pirin family protein n=1 Tax=Candidatus Blastococcus massiliensis TaxID=1470358 RepID=UPI0004BCFF00|nr:pirin family protein [Candidatus Blastococcus massiliensis]